MKDIEQELLELAEDKVTQKLKEENEKNKQRIKQEIEDVKFILDLIEKRILYKIEGDWRSSRKFVMITKEIFFEDYSKEPEYKWQAKLQIEKYDSWEDNYNLDIEVNGIKYKHIGCVLQDYIKELNKEKRNIEEIAKKLRESEERYKELERQEPIIKGFIEEYNSTQEKIKQS